MYNIDRLYEAVSAKGHVCVGLDTAPDYIPPVSRRRSSSDAEAVLAYNRAIINATADIAACYKVQIAYYEALGRAGLDAYAQTLAMLREKKSLVIADIKRGDIADTALQYAKAHFEGDFEADFVTLSPYMGMDSIEPWIAFAENKGKGAFVLLRTSNKGMRDFQYLELREESFTDSSDKEREDNRDCDDSGNCVLPSASAFPEGKRRLCVKKIQNNFEPRRLCHAVGDRLAALADRYCGSYGYGAFGAVVGADPKSDSEKKEAAAIRERYSNLFFLIPGYGAQGGAAEDAALLLKDGNGGVVNASRSVLKAWTAKTEKDGLRAEPDIDFASEAAREAVVIMRDAIRAAVKK